MTQERRRWLPGKSRRQILGTCLTGEDIVEERRGFQTKGESLDPMLSQRLVSRQAADCRLAGAVLSHLLLRHVSLCDCPPHGGTSPITLTGVFGMVLTTRCTASVTREMAAVKSDKTTPAMMETHSFTPYLIMMMIIHLLDHHNHERHFDPDDGHRHLLPSPASLWRTSV